MEQATPKKYLKNWYKGPAAVKKPVEYRFLWLRREKTFIKSFRAKRDRTRSTWRHHHPTQSKLPKVIWLLLILLLLLLLLLILMLLCKFLLLLLLFLRLLLLLLLLMLLLPLTIKKEMQINFKGGKRRHAMHVSQSNPNKLRAIEMDFPKWRHTKTSSLSKFECEVQKLRSNTTAPTNLLTQPIRTP